MADKLTAHPSEVDRAWSYYKHADDLIHTRTGFFLVAHSFLAVALSRAGITLPRLPLALLGVALAVVWLVANSSLITRMNVLVKYLRRDPLYLEYLEKVPSGIGRFAIVWALPLFVLTFWSIPAITDSTAVFSGDAVVETAITATPWNSLEIAKLIVALLTPIVVAVVGVSFARSAERRARAHARADERLRVLQRVPTVVAQATAWSLAVAMRRTFIESLLQMKTDHPEWVHLDADLEETKQFYQRDREALHQASAQLGEVIVASEFILTGEVSTRLRAIQEFIVSLGLPNQHLAQLRSFLVSHYETLRPGVDVGSMSLFANEALAAFLQPIQAEMDRLKANLAEVVREQIAA